MSSSTFSNLCDEFIRLPIELQYQEIGNLFILVGGIRISQNRDETDEEFRIRTFQKGLKSLADESEYESEFFEYRIIPSLIEDFNDSSVERQEVLMDKLMELTDGSSMKKKSGESYREFRSRMYPQMLRKIRGGYEFEMVEFARQIVDYDEDESDNNESDEEDESEEDEYDHKSTSTRRDRGYSGGQKVNSKRNSGPSRRRDYSDSDGGSVSAVEFVGDVELVQEGGWNDGSKKAVFNPKLKLKAKSKPNSSRTSNSKPTYRR